MNRIIAAALLVMLATLPSYGGFGIRWNGTSREYFFSTADNVNMNGGIYCSGAGWAALADGNNGGFTYNCGHKSRAAAERAARDRCNQSYGGCRVTWSGYDDDRRNTGWDYMYNLVNFQSYY